MGSRTLTNKGLLTALVFGLSVHVLTLMSQLHELAPARRILLVLVAFRLLEMVHSSVNSPERPPLQRNWQTALLPLLLAIFPLVVWWATAVVLPHSAKFALAMSLITLFLIVHLVLVLRKPQPVQYKTGQFLMNSLFALAYGLAFALGTLGLMVLSPEFLDDLIAIGGHTFNFYIIMFAVRLVTGLLFQPNQVPAPNNRSL